MDTGSEAITPSNKSVDVRENPTCLEIADKGINTGKDFAKFMSCLMTDLIKGTVTAGVGNATCNAGGKLLKVVEMQHRFGVKGGGEGKDEHELRLT